MHNFKNQKIQELYDYLVEDFGWNDLYYDEEGSIEKIKPFINVLNEKDWASFELTIDQWDSSILYQFATIITYDNSPNYPYEKLYCLAFVNCDYFDANELLDDLIIVLSLNNNMSKRLIIEVINRVNSFLDGYVYFNNSTSKERTEKTKKILNEKLKLISSQLNKD